MKKIIVILIFFPLLSFAQKPKTQIEFSSVFENLPFSTFDERFSSTLLSFFQNLEKGIYDKKAALLLRSISEKSDAFGEFENPIETSIKLDCNDLIKNTHPQNGRLANEWIKKLKKYCRINILNRISQGKMEKEEEELFYFSLPVLLQGESEKFFVSFLATMNKDSKLGPKVMDLVAKSILFLKMVPSDKIIQQLNLNKELTSFFQSENLFKENQESVFLNEFKNIINSFLSQPHTNLQASTNPAVSFLKNNQSFLSSDSVYKSLRVIGYDQLRTKNKLKAQEVYRICQEFSPPDKKLESNFFLLWPSIFTNNFPEAVHIIKQTNMMENFDSYPSNVQFWIAYSLQKNNDLILARSFYEKLIHQNHLDYYSILAIKTLKELNPSFDPVKFIESTKSSFHVFNFKLDDLKPNFKAGIIRAFLWLDQGREDYYKMEIDNILNSNLNASLKRPNNVPEKEFKSWVALNILGMLNIKGYYLNTFKLAFDLIDKNYLDFSLPILKTLFPMSYFSKIKEIESGVDPIITLSLIRQESAFNPKARSIAGATGLMQLMPTTAKTLKPKIKNNQLNNPDINLTLGILYLEKLLKKYDGNLIMTLSAYNAGEKKLNTWLKDYFLNQDPVVMVESIPYEETRNYVKLIYRNIFFYKYLSSDQKAFNPVENSFIVEITD